ncbi:hypothetical protein ACFPLB_04110 [Aquamicrobium segne]|uniref:Uncharacterized protein n=1 Tax=Aquamicrobium segne TaxID=469547 RepID=A0ABW0GXL6_9HYPH
MNTKAHDQFLVFDMEDRFNASVCYGEDETREIVRQFDCPESLQVLRVTMGHPTRDVTSDFITEDEPDAAFGIPSPDSLRCWHEGRVL